MSEPWLDRKKLAQHYSCSVRIIEEALTDGLPHAVIFGRKKFQVSTVEPWLIARGHMRVDGGRTMDHANGAAALPGPAPGHEE